VRKQPEQLGEMTGQLKKLSPSLFTGWQDRYIVLKDKKMKYFTTKNAKFASGVLNFDHFDTKIEKCDKKTKFNMNITGIDRTFEFKAENEK